MKEKKGGAYVGVGTYGCVFNPYLGCQGTPTGVPADALGKVFKENGDSSLLDEIALNKRVAQIDPGHAFTVPFYGRCRTDPTKVKVNDEVSRCKAVALDKEDRDQLLYKYGGIDWHKMLMQMHMYGLAYDDVIRMGYGLAKGLVVLAKHGIAHMDIKPPNVLYDPATARMRLIDFGIMTRFADIKDQDHLIGYSYPYYPVELRVMYNKKYGITHGSDYSEYLDNFNFFEAKTPEIINIMHALAPMQEAKAFIADMASMSHADYCAEFDKKWASKVDVFSLGITLLEIYGLLNVMGLLVIRDKAFVQGFMDRVLRHMLCARPEGRMSSAELAVAWRAFLKDFALPVTPSPAKAPRVPTPRPTPPAAPPKAPTPAAAPAKIESPLSPLVLTQTTCQALKGAQIKELLVRYKLPTYGSKQIMCERLMKKFFPAPALSPNSECMKRKVADLKKELSTKGLPTKGVKKELCARLMNKPLPASQPKDKKKVKVTVKAKAKGVDAMKACLDKKAVDIRAELAKKGLAKYGTKQVMCERLLSGRKKK